jgi:phosphonopyruvate decarboxylase
MRIEDFGEVLKRNGVFLGTGVPCSYFSSLVNYMSADPALDYLSATSEGEAVAIAAGMVAAGRPAFALMQNSGLGNAVNPITSMLDIYQLPVVLLISHRGQPGLADEPQHARMGLITEELARLCGLETHVFETQRFEPTLRAALVEGRPVAYIVRKGALHGGPAAQPLATAERAPQSAPRATGGRRQMSREEALRAILPMLNRGLAKQDRTEPVAVVSSTGKLSRELYELDDRSADKCNRFYMVGSMGCAAGFALGVARARPDRNVLVLDGDGALLMKLGSLATVGYVAPENYHHVTFDNAAHESTGGQPTPSPAVDLALAAVACGYRCAETVDTVSDVYDALARHLALRGPTYLRVLIRVGSRGDLGRPALSPRQCYARFSAFLRGAPR